VVGGQYGGPFCGAAVGNMDPAAEVAALKQFTGAWWWWWWFTDPSGFTDHGNVFDPNGLGTCEHTRTQTFTTKHILIASSET